MSKFIISMLNTLFCAFVLVVCIISWGDFDNWKDRTIATLVILGSAHLIAVLLNRVLPHNLHILGGIVELVEGPLLVIAAIICMDILEPWPMKIIGMFAWVVFMLFRPSFTARDKE